MSDNGALRTAVVVAKDTVTGQLLEGIVSTANGTTGQTNQPLTYPSCGSALSADQTANALPPAPMPCTGTVQVLFYGVAAFQDFANAATLSIEKSTLRPAHP